MPINIQSLKKAQNHLRNKNNKSSICIELMIQGKRKTTKSWLIIKKININICIGMNQPFGGTPFLQYVAFYLSI